MSAVGDLARFRELLGIRLGWAFADTDLPQLDQVMTGRAQDLGLSPAGYLTRLAAPFGTDELNRLTERLAITETCFFRHAEQFRALTYEVLPEIVKQRHDQGVLKLLSVGCSSGEEAYTLAMVARLARPDTSWLVSVLGLDANPAMLERAREARYSAWALRDTPDTVRERWFRLRDDGLYEVDARIRETVRFRQHNVAEDDPVIWRPSQYDVIMCRNLLMYLNPATAEALIQRMTRALLPGGHLFLGHTDSLGPRPDGLELRQSQHTYFYRRPAPHQHRASTPPARRKVPTAAPGPDPYGQALALLRDERYVEALDLLEADLGARPQPRDRLLHSVLLAQAGRLDDAEVVCRRLLEDDGLYADAHHLLGVCLEDGSAVDVAVGHYRLAAYLDPGFAMPRLRLGLLSRRRGDERTAAAELDQAVELLRDESQERISLFGGGFGRIALAALCRTERGLLEEVGR